jgi:hypothetical protein
VLLWHVQVLYELPKGVEVPPTAAAAVSSVEEDVPLAAAAVVSSEGDEGEPQQDSESSKGSDG